MFRKAVLVALLTVGCGARTSLSFEEADADAIAPDMAADTTATDTFVPPDTALPDTLIEDVPFTEVGCTSDLECDDGIDCTDDVCNPAVGLCRNIPVHGRCDDGQFCTGDERCDAVRGCVTTPRNCSDSVACTVDTCDEASKSCVRTPNDTLCPVSHGCDQTLGCQARAIAHTRTDMYEIRLPSGVVNKIGPTTGTLTDLALRSDGTLYAIRFDGLCQADPKTGACITPVRPLSGNPVGLDFAPSGTLYSAAGSTVYSLNLTTGVQTPAASYPMGMSASGDIAFVGTRMLGTANAPGSGGDALVEFDLASRTARSLGRTGFSCIWGLAAYGPTLYGLTCNGQVLSINPNTGASTVLSVLPGTEFWGATAR